MNVIELFIIYYRFDYYFTEQVISVAYNYIVQLQKIFFYLFLYQRNHPGVNDSPE